MIFPTILIIIIQNPYKQIVYKDTLIILSLLAACEDTNEKCDYWADIGECEANPGYMLINCQLSCGLCGKWFSGNLV